MLQKTEI